MFKFLFNHHQCHKCNGWFSKKDFVAKYHRCYLCFIALATVDDCEIRPCEFKEADDYVRMVNSIDLDDIEVDGIEITDKVREQWHMIGRNNWHFVQQLLDWDEQGLTPVQDIWEADDATD
jgi:hypothetical protein